MRTLEGQTIADAGSWTSEDCKRLRTSADAEVGTNADGKRLRTIADAESWTNADARRPWTIADDARTKNRRVRILPFTSQNVLNVDVLRTSKGRPFARRVQEV